MGKLGGSLRTGRTVVLAVSNLKMDIPIFFPIERGVRQAGLSSLSHIVSPCNRSSPQGNGVNQTRFDD